MSTHTIFFVEKSGPEVIKRFSTQPSMKFFMLVNLKLLTMPNSFLLNITEYEKIILI